MLDFSLPRVISFSVILLIAFPIHELAHAIAADYFGDDTPRLHGRLTLNPLAHLDLFGSLTLILAGFGWAKPVPVNEYALERRSRYAPALVALAGPASNLLLGLLAGGLLATGLIQPPTELSRYLPSFYEVLFYFSLINFVLFFFNLIPLFPLDGEKILIRVLPYEWGVRWESLRRFTFGPLIVLVWLLPALNVNLIGSLVFSPSSWLLRLFIGG
ncbi:MAG TPA: site-2 protease family protein [Anaerolineales bacterium]|jgi:Zn-dependent protease|nr:site-2 protease family protein [Anaerolineales bacterium]